MPLKHIGYVRCSTDRQQISIEAQEVKIRAMATLKDIQIDEVIVDSDESAKSLERPGMNRLLKMVDDGDVSMVICAKLDRITRSVGDLAELLRVFDGNAVSLVSVEESLDTSSASGRLVLNIMVSVSQWEREAIGERTKAALDHLKSQNFRTGSPPFGFRAARRTQQEKDLKIRKPLIEDPAEQNILKRIKDLVAKELTWPAIAGILNREGFRTRSGGDWQYQAVHRIYNTVILKRP